MHGRVCEQVLPGRYLPLRPSTRVIRLRVLVVTTSNELKGNPEAFVRGNKRTLRQKKAG